MLGTGLATMSWATAAVMALTTLPATATAECSFCRYTAWNCSTEAAILATEAKTVFSSGETSVQATASTKNELRKAIPTTVEPPEALAVCNAEGKIQVDDVFCDGSECACADGRSCVSLQMGCQTLFQARSRKRCVGEGAIQQRFQKCATAQALTVEPTANLDADWLYFKQPKRCKSADCLAVRRFQSCGVVQCGYLVVAWKERATSSAYRFVVDGSRAKDMKAGTFVFTMDVSASASRSSCAAITSSEIQDCYALQTRNEQNGTCDGIYLQANTKLQAAGDYSSYQLSTLNWPEWLAVVGSVIAAVASVASVVLMVLRHRREQREDEHNELLRAQDEDDRVDDQQSTGDPLKLQTTVSSLSPPVRQRVLSPRSLGSQAQ